MSAVNGNCLGDRNRPEATWIQDINFAVDRGLGDGAGKRFTWGRAAAWIGVVSNTGYPGTRRLRLSQRSKRKREDRDCQYVNREPKLVHLEFPFSFESLAWPPVEHRSFRPLLRRSFPLFPTNAFPSTYDSFHN